jgi:hypothetical protein
MTNFEAFDTAIVTFLTPLTSSLLNRISLHFSNAPAFIASEVSLL